MRRTVIVLLILLLAFALYWFFFRKSPDPVQEQKQAPIALKTHSSQFNQSIDNVVNAYLHVKDAFINSDSARARQGGVHFIALLDSVPVDELKNDTAIIYEAVQANITDLKSNMQSLVERTNLTDMKQDFSMVTEMLYPAFFKMINYEGPTLYLQNCPMAFGDDKGANWISKSDEVINPYLGKDHPEYKSSMLHCGEVKDSIKAN